MREHTEPGKGGGGIGMLGDPYLQYNGITTLIVKASSRLFAKYNTFQMFQLIKLNMSVWPWVDQ